MRSTNASSINSSRREPTSIGSAAEAEITKHIETRRVESTEFNRIDVASLANLPNCHGLPRRILNLWRIRRSLQLGPCVLQSLSRRLEHQHPLCRRMNAE